VSDLGPKVSGLGFKVSRRSKGSTRCQRPTREIHTAVMVAKHSRPRMNVTSVLDTASLPPRPGPTGGICARAAPPAGTCAPMVRGAGRGGRGGRTSYDVPSVSVSRVEGKPLRTSLCPARTVQGVHSPKLCFRGRRISLPTVRHYTGRRGVST
jgi:hypothetical protein